MKYPQVITWLAEPESNPPGQHADIWGNGDYGRSYKKPPPTRIPGKPSNVFTQLCHDESSMTLRETPVR